MDRLLCGGFIAYNTSFVCTPENNVRVLPWFALPVPCWIGLPPRTCCVGQYVFKGGQALPFLFIYRAEAIRQGLYRCNAGQHARGKQFTYTKHVICYVCMPTGVSKRSFTGMLHCTWRCGPYGIAGDFAKFWRWPVTVARWSASQRSIRRVWCT